MSKRTANEGLRLAQAHFNRMELGGTAPTANERLALSTLLFTLNAASLLSKFTALYPFIGSAAAPQALDAVGGNDITWGGTLTHDADGVVSNGSTGYGDTGVDGASFSTSSYHHSFYINNAPTPASQIPMGANTTGNRIYSIIDISWTPDALEHYMMAATAFVATEKVPNDQSIETPFGAHHLATLDTGLSSRAYVDGVLMGTSTPTNGTMPSQNVYVCALGNGGAATHHCQYRLAFASIGTTITDAEALIISNANLAFQTTLGRQI